MKKSESLPLLFCYEWPEQIAHGRSFEKSDGSDSLLGIKSGNTVKKKWEILIFERFACFCDHSHSFFLKSNDSDSPTSLFVKEQREWITHGHFLKWAILSERTKSEWVKERIPNPNLKHLKKAFIFNNQTGYMEQMSQKVFSKDVYKIKIL